MNERDRGLLLKIKDEAEFLLEVTENRDLHNFLTDRRLQYVVLMALIKIEESVKSLSKELKQEYQEIEWRDITGFRDIAVHNYDGLHMERVWGNVTKDVPELLEQVEGILRDLPP